MSARSHDGFLNLSGNLTRAGGRGRDYLLPPLTPLPKAERRPAPVAVITGGPEVPEMTTDMIDPATSYPAGNVRRSPGARRNNFGSWLDRMFSGHRAARL